MKGEWDFHQAVGPFWPPVGLFYINEEHISLDKFLPIQIISIRHDTKCFVLETPAVKNVFS